VHEALAKIGGELADSGWAAELYDEQWRLCWVSPELRLLLGEGSDEQLGYGRHILEVFRHPRWREASTEESRQAGLRRSLPYIIHDTPGGAERVAELLDPGEAHLLDGLGDQQPPPLWTIEIDFRQAEMPPVRVSCMHMRIHDAEGRFVGTARVYGPALRASVLSFVARGDEEMFERMTRLVTPGRQRVAIVFADLQDSSALARRLPSSVYFRLISALTKAIDDVIVNHHGIVGKHVGDGVSAFFIASDHGSPSAAARAAIATASDIHNLAGQVAREIGEQSGIGEAIRCQMNIGIHWGNTLYVGQIVSGGRLEITALGDQVNECARIEAAAREGQILASKALIECLEEEDAQALGIDPAAVIYETLAELEGQALVPAGHIPVAELEPTARALEASAPSER
jgi:class 3 adenylate cyclase